MVRVIGEDGDEFVSMWRRGDLSRIVFDFLGGNSVSPLKPCSLPSGLELSPCFGVVEPDGYTHIKILSDLDLVVVTDRGFYQKAYDISKELEAKTGRPFVLRERYFKAVED